MEIKHNIGIDLGYALYRFARREPITDHFIEKGISVEKGIEEWISFVEDNISNLLKSDVEQLFRDTPANLFVILWTIVDNNLDSVDNLFIHLEKLDVDKYLSYIYDSYLGIENPSEEAILEKLSGENKQKEAKCINQCIRYPEITISRLNQTLKMFYNDFIVPYEEKINSVLDETIKKDQKLLNTDINKFFDTISSNLYKYNGQEILLYSTYFFDFSRTTYMRTHEENTPFMIYNIWHDKKASREQIKKQTVDLFKTLADEKRIDILRLLNKRKWYSKELADYFGLSTATMSYHINKLADIGLINMETGEMNRLYYSLNEEKVKEIFESIVKDAFEIN